MAHVNRLTQDASRFDRDGEEYELREVRVITVMSEDDYHEAIQDLRSHTEGRYDITALSHGRTDYP